MTPKEEKYLIDSQKRLERAIIGDPEMDHEGLIEKVKRHELFLEKLKKKLWVISGVTVGACTTIPELIEYIKKTI